MKVRAAGLWEYPVGKMALQKGTTGAVRTAGRHLVDGHAALDATCRGIATRLNTTPPPPAAGEPQVRLAPAP